MDLTVKIEVKDYDIPDNLSSDDIVGTISESLPIMMSEYFECDDFIHCVAFDGDDIILSVEGEARTHA